MAVIDFSPPVMLLEGDWPLARVWIAGGEIDQRLAVVHRACQIDAELLEHVALDFGDRHLEHDLIVAANDDGIDDLAAGRNRIGATDAEQPRRNIIGLLRFGLARRRAGKHDAVADALDLDIGIRQHLRDSLAHAVEIARHRNIKAADLLAVGIEEKHISLPGRHADDVGAARRSHDGVGDLGIGNQHVANVARQIDNDRLADAERQRLRFDVAGGDMDRLRRRLQRDVAGDGAGSDPRRDR